MSWKLKDPETVPTRWLELKDGFHGWGDNAAAGIGFARKADADAFGSTIDEPTVSDSVGAAGDTWVLERDGSSPSEYLAIDINGRYEYVTDANQALQMSSSGFARNVNLIFDSDPNHTEQQII